MTATQVTVIPTGTPGRNGMDIYLSVNGHVTHLSCHVSDASGCTSSGTESVPANSTLSIEVANGDASPGDLLTTLVLQ